MENHQVGKLQNSILGLEQIVTVKFEGLRIVGSQITGNERDLDTIP
jgi:hypothetical protein